MSDTVDVILDRWSLKDGHDIHSFMEEMVKSDDIFRVLIICNQKYSEKADDREGGVGTETQIISPNLYSNIKQEKFIPILLERDENGEPYLPIYLSSRKYIDFSQEEGFEDSYEELLRNILEVPSIPKPLLGTKPPVYITENRINLSDTNSKIRTIENQLKRNQTLNPKYAYDFTELFLEKLWNFNLDKTPNNLDEFGMVLTDTLKSFKPLREDFLKFVNILTSYQLDFVSDPIIEFFEYQPLYLRPKDDRGGWSPAEFDSLNIIFQELFIYTVALGLKNKNYEFVSEILNSKYFIKDPHQRNEEPSTFAFLYNYHKNLEDYLWKTYNKVTGFGDYVITNLSDQLSKNQIILGDTVCYAVSYLNNEDYHDRWFPSTYLYGDKHEAFDFFSRISSRKHFEKVKCIFDVDNKNDFRKKILDLKESSQDRIRYSHGVFNDVSFVHELINADTIALYR